jgi:alanyl aminopeptidase
VLGVVQRLAHHANPQVVGAVASLAAAVRDEGWVEAAQQASYARWIRDLFGARARPLGWLAKKNESADASGLRWGLVHLVADHGEDAELIASAKSIAGAWLRDGRRPEGDLDRILAVAAAHGDAAQLEAWARAARSDRDRRKRLLRALGHSRDPALLSRALALLIEGEPEGRDVVEFLRTAAAWSASQPVVWSFVRDHFDALAARMPRDTEASLIPAADGLCDESAARELRQFLGERAARMTNGPHTLALVDETVRACAAVRAWQAPIVSRFLAAQKN